MKKQYTKKQIVEAIKHWKSVLSRIDESKSPLLDAFIEEFGEEVVLSHDYKFIYLTEDVFKRIYSIVNKWLFGNRLSLLPVEVVDHCDEQMFLAAYVFTYYFDGKLLKLVTKTMVDPDGNKHLSPRFMLPSDTVTLKMPFMFIANVIAHEMIHQFTMEHGAELQEMLDDLMAKREHNPHGTVFKRFMDAANKEYGMRIQTSVEHSMNIEFGNAVQDARRKLAETEHSKPYDDIVPGDVIIDNKNLTLTTHGNGFFTGALY